MPKSIVRKYCELYEEDQKSEKLYKQAPLDDEEIIIQCGRREFSNSFQAFREWTESGLEELVQTNVKNSFYANPRKIQSYAIPAILQGFDLMGHASTGSGKTAAFLLPIISSILKFPRPCRLPLPMPAPLAVIIVPTRELCLQIYEQAIKFSYRSGISVAKAYGSFSINRNVQELLSGSDILIATPGRLLDFLRNNKVRLHLLRFFVLDEADYLLLDADFHEELHQIRNHSSFPQHNRFQTLIFSATFVRRDIELQAKSILRPDFFFISNNKLVTPNHRIEEKFFEVNKSQKDAKLIELLNSDERRATERGKIERTLVFIRSRNSANPISDKLNALGFSTHSLTSDCSQYVRECALLNFRRKYLEVLVATGLLGRGMDVKELTHVILYDLPNTFVEYVHRVGRTGRISKGIATAFIDPTSENDKSLIWDIVKHLQTSDKEVPEFLTRLKDEVPDFESSPSECDFSSFSNSNNGSNRASDEGDSFPSDQFPNRRPLTKRNVGSDTPTSRRNSSAFSSSGTAPAVHTVINWGGRSSTGNYAGSDQQPTTNDNSNGHRSTRCSISTIRTFSTSSDVDSADGTCLAERSQSTTFGRVSNKAGRLYAKAPVENDVESGQFEIPPGNAFRRNAIENNNNLKDNFIAPAARSFSFGRNLNNGSGSTLGNNFGNEQSAVNSGRLSRGGSAGGFGIHNRQLSQPPPENRTHHNSNDFSRSGGFKSNNTNNFGGQRFNKGRRSVPSNRFGCRSTSFNSRNDNKNGSFNFSNDSENNTPVANLIVVKGSGFGSSGFGNGFGSANAPSERTDDKENSSMFSSTNKLPQNGDTNPAQNTASFFGSFEKRQFGFINDQNAHFSNGPTEPNASLSLDHQKSSLNNKAIGFGFLKKPSSQTLPDQINMTFRNKDGFHDFNLHNQSSSPTSSISTLIPEDLPIKNKILRHATFVAGGDQLNCKNSSSTSSNESLMSSDDELDSIPPSITSQFDEDKLIITGKIFTPFDDNTPTSSPPPGPSSSDNFCNGLTNNKKIFFPTINEDFDDILIKF